jgi:signal transduction histidine kinase
VVAEAVHNVGTHSRGSCLEVVVAVRSDRLEATVVDDGIGPPGRPVHGLGLGSMAARARELRGTFEFGSGPSGGATVSWCVPVPATRSG